MAKKRKTVSKVKVKTWVLSSKSGKKPISIKGKFPPIKGITGSELKGAIADILGANPQEIFINLGDGIGPGGSRVSRDEPSWDGNVYKYRY